MSAGGGALPPPSGQPVGDESKRRGLEVWHYVVGGAAVLFVLVAGASAVLTSGDDDGDGGGSRGDLIPAHREMVDNLADDGDCASLQDRFDDADANRGEAGSEQARRNAALMRYADEAMRRIGCY